MRRESGSPTDTILFEGAALGVLLGSGLDAVSEGFPIEATLPFSQIEGLSPAAVVGHKGELKRCVVSGRPCLFICGRKHYYEGSAEEIRALMGFLHRNGLRRLLLTSAAGSLTKSVFPGELVLVSDLIDAQFRPPGKGRTGLGDGGQDLSTGRPSSPLRLALDETLSRDLWMAASRANVGLGRGAAVICAGPVYETPAEIRALQETGAFVVTMSGAPEVEIANMLGIRVAMVAVATNWAAGISTVRLRHEDVLDVARAAAAGLRQLVVKFVETSQGRTGGERGWMGA